ncbi:OLC1v1007574C1 [Oldenlandia corymbosa var. corymbosa]|uniref:OLC1v1007574C1 n=1 Tax=Oldenlandia corymbosa var. corymbosa TaxID=529605 RepID=A0AAV1DJK9_OLDCO|nr:OLC1v1007574C1 [Oldenlandia corymbosa var. corymbosa]
MAIISDQYCDQHARAAWKSCMASAFRTAVACIIVGCATLFGPTSLKNQVTLPAFSYVTVILIITDATLGDTFRGCWHALHASLFGICPAILTLWLIGPAQLTASITAIAVAASAFVVVVQENSHLIAKRIALGQIVLVYVLAFINGPKADPIMHPVHVLASTFVGVAACVLALLLPYPSLATSEVKKNFKLFTKNASERLKVFVKAFSAEDKKSANALISQAKSMANMGTKLLKTVKSKQESMAWERIPINFFKPYITNPAEKLHHLETPLRGMEIAVSSNNEQFPVGILNSDQKLKDEITRTENHIARQIKSMHLVSAITIPENVVDHQHHLPALPDQTIPLDKKDLPSFFFLFCLKLLQKKSMAAAAISTQPLISNPSKTGPQKEEDDGDQSFLKSAWKNFASYLKNKRLMPAFKSSLSLGLAVFLGAIYSKENAYWAGLPVAISLAASREATFKVANVKAQGTVLGTVFGVFGWFMFQKYVLIRLLSLLPWFIFCSFLRRSRMYGQAGGISAVIGAILILGRKNFGPPSEFAIARITETFIGLSCSIAVEMILQPTRAASQAKTELSKNLQVIKECVGGISLNASKANLDESLKILKVQVNELGKFIGEAEVEPNFWFLPFHSACYGKLLRSLSKMVEFMVFTTSAIESFQQEEKGGKMDSNLWKENVNRLNLDLNVFKNTICSSIMCCEEVSLIKSLQALDNEIEKKSIATDLELGKSKITFSGPKDQEMMEKKLASFLQHCQQLLDDIKSDEKDEMKSQILLSLSTLGFCMDGLIRETKEIEKGMVELLQWENPSSHVDLHDISSKISALQTSDL